MSYRIITLANNVILNIVVVFSLDSLALESSATRYDTIPYCSIYTYFLIYTNINSNSTLNNVVDDHHEGNSFSQRQSGTTGDSVYCGVLSELVEFQSKIQLNTHTYVLHKFIFPNFLRFLFQLNSERSVRML